MIAFLKALFRTPQPGDCYVVDPSNPWNCNHYRVEEVKRGWCRCTYVCAGRDSHQTERTCAQLRWYYTLIS